MSEASPPSQGAGLSSNTILHVIYGLYASSIVISFLFFFGVIFAYMQRGKSLTGMQRSHVFWQIRTFWWGCLFFVIATTIMFLLTSFGSAFVSDNVHEILSTYSMIFVFGFVFFWFICRIGKGWYYLANGRQIERPYALI